MTNLRDRFRDRDRDHWRSIQQDFAHTSNLKVRMFYCSVDNLFVIYSPHSSTTYLLSKFWAKSSDWMDAKNCRKPTSKLIRMVALVKYVIATLIDMHVWIKTYVGCDYQCLLIWENDVNWHNILIFYQLFHSNTINESPSSKFIDLIWIY